MALRRIFSTAWAKLLRCTCTWHVLSSSHTSASSGQPVRWVRVHNLPGFAYFDHRPHLRAGVGCSTCHGRIDQMDVVAQAQPLSMSWCLDCHRNPDKYIRPRDQVFNMSYERPTGDPEFGLKLVREHKIASVEQLTSCSTCHR